MRGSQMKKPGKRMVEMMRGAMEPGVDQPFEAPRVLKASIKRTMTTSILDISYRKISFSKLFVEH